MPEPIYLLIYDSVSGDFSSNFPDISQCGNYKLDWADGSTKPRILKLRYDQDRKLHWEKHALENQINYKGDYFVMHWNNLFYFGCCISVETACCRALF